MKLDRESIEDVVDINELKEHLTRYLFATSYIQSATHILDCACGIGYGAYLLSKACKGCKVDGIDKNKRAINYAKKNFSRRNTRFIYGDIFETAFHKKYDCIISFETIEHVTSYKKLLRIFKSNLKKGGTLILSSPNKKLMSPYLKKPMSRYHLKEFELEELQSILLAHFPSVDPFVQKHTFNKVIVRTRQATSKLLSLVSDRINRRYLNITRSLNNRINKKEFIRMNRRTVSGLFNASLRSHTSFPTQYENDSERDYLFEVFVCRKGR